MILLKFTHLRTHTKSASEQYEFNIRFDKDIDIKVLNVNSIMQFLEFGLLKLRDIIQRCAKWLTVWHGAMCQPKVIKFGRCYRMLHYRQREITWTRHETNKFDTVPNERQLRKCNTKIKLFRRVCRVHICYSIPSES